MPTDTERRNLDVIPIRWQGHEAFIIIEEAVEKAAPQRRAEILETIAAGNRVIVQAVLKDASKGPDWKAPFCAILTFKDGLIIKDETYMDLRVWPSPKMSREQWQKIPLLDR